MNDILMPSLIEHFNLNYTKATLVQFSFYITYILFPLPIGWMIHSYGYKTSLIVALVFCAAGCGLFYPAWLFNSYPIVLIAIFTLSTGLTVINVAANPFITLLGDDKEAHIRINFVQVFSRIGYAATPLIATALIFKSTGAIHFHFPYLVLAGVLVFFAMLLFFSNTPAMLPASDDRFSLSGIVRKSRHNRHLFFGIAAMFFYVGAEASTAGFFIPYLTKEIGLSTSESAGYLTTYYILAALMGMASVIILRYIAARKLVGFFGLGMIVCYLLVIFAHSAYNAWFLATLGLLISIMFPTLFSLAIEGLTTFAGRASALLNMAITGGAVFPPLQGLVADNFGLRTSYLIPCGCFIFVTLYAFLFTKKPAN